MTKTLKDRLGELKKPVGEHPRPEKYIKEGKSDIEFSHDIHHYTKDEAFNAGIDACLPLLEEEYRQGFDDGMKHREFLICSCGCPMRIDAKDYQEKHSGEALTPLPDKE